jgi:hypothetical protein
MNEIVQQLIPLAVVMAAMYLLVFICRRLECTRWEKTAHRCFRFLAVAFWPVALISAGAFPLRPGIVLGLLLAFVGYEVGKAAQKPTRKFTPYWVWVRLNAYELLEDFKLVSGHPEEWKAIRESLESSTEHRVLRDGLRFTVIRESEDLTHTMIYWNNYGTFLSEIRFYIDMSPIQAPSDPSEDHPGPPKCPPAEFFIRAGGSAKVAALCLGLRVPQRWWEHVKAECPAPIEQGSNPLIGCVELTLAVLPYTEFDMYWQPQPTDWSLERERKQRVKAQVNEYREKFGWTTKDHPDDFRPDGGWPESIGHKYFDVEHRAI